MDIGINPSGSQFAVVCLALGCCALPALLLLVGGQLAGGRLALISLLASLVPMFWGEISALLGRGGGREDEVLAPVGQIVDRVRQRRSNIESKLKRADRDFDAQLSMNQNPTQFDQDNAPDDIETQAYNIDETLPTDTGKSRWGVRDRAADPNRILRDRRFKRNRGPRKIPDDIQEGLVDEEGDIRAPKGEDLLGPGSLPGLRGRSRFGSSNRPLRDRRGRGERSDDEVFGGMLDDDGDAFPDF